MQLTVLSLNCMSYVITAILFSVGPPFRKGIHSNSKFDTLTSPFVTWKSNRAIHGRHLLQPYPHDYGDPLSCPRLRAQTYQREYSLSTPFVIYDLSTVQRCSGPVQDHAVLRIAGQLLTMHDLGSGGDPEHPERGFIEADSQATRRHTSAREDRAIHSERRTDAWSRYFERTRLNPDPGDRELPYMPPQERLPEGRTGLV